MVAERFSSASSALCSWRPRAAFAQAPAARAQPAAPPTKFVTPIQRRGGTSRCFLPQSSQEGNLLVTKIKVKNVSKGPIVGFKADGVLVQREGGNRQRVPDSSVTRSR